MVTAAMSATRSQRRREQRAAAKGKVESSKGLSPRELVFRRLRRRVRYVLLGTSLAGLLLLRFFHQPVAGWLEHYGFAARVALVLALLSPALITWVIGLGELKDAESR